MNTIAATEELRKECMALADACSQRPGSTKLMRGALMETVNAIAKKLPPGQAERLLEDVRGALSTYAGYKANRKGRFAKRGLEGAN